MHTAYLGSFLMKFLLIKFCDIGIVTGIEANHKTMDKALAGQEVCIKIEPIGDTPKMFGRHFTHEDLLMSKVSILFVSLFVLLYIGMDLCFKPLMQLLCSLGVSFLVEIRKPYVLALFSLKRQHYFAATKTLLNFLYILK